MLKHLNALEDDDFHLEIQNTNVSMSLQSDDGGELKDLLNSLNESARGLRSTRQFQELKREEKDPLSWKMNMSTTSLIDEQEIFKIQQTQEMFVTPENFEATVEQLNQRLAAASFPQLTFQVSSKEAVSAVHVIYLLLQQRQKDFELRDSLYDKNSRLKCDNENLSQNVKMLKSKVETYTVAVESLKNKCKEKEKEVQKIAKEYSAKMNELVTANNNYQQKCIQYAHSCQRYEREANSVKEKMQKLIADKGVWKSKAEVINADQRKESFPPLRKKGQQRNEQIMYDNVIGAFEDNWKETEKENNELRELLQDALKEIEKLRVAVLSTTNNNIASSVPDLLPAQMQLPMSIVKQEVEETIKKKVEEVQELLSKYQSTKNDTPPELIILSQFIAQASLDTSQLTDLQEIIDKLKTRLLDYQRVIHEQDAVLKLNIMQRSEGISSLLNSSPASNEILAEERHLLEEQKRMLDKERQDLENMALQLDKEKLNIMKEKKKLEHMKNIEEEDGMYLEDEKENILLNNQAISSFPRKSTSFSSNHADLLADLDVNL